MIIIEIIDLKNYKYNYDVLKKISRKDIIPVIKTDAYGIGIINAVKALDSPIYACNDLREAKQISHIIPNKEILILSKVDVNDYHYLYEMDNLILSITSIKDITNLINYCYLSKIKVHIYIDTGMNRFGINNISDYQKALEMLNSSKFKLTGIYTHITSTNNLNNQLNNFKKYLDIYTPELVHVCASSTYLQSKNIYTSRIGLDLLCDGSKDYLKQVIKVIVKAVEIRKLSKGDTLGYNESYIACNDTYIAILPIGYSNGFDRRLTGYEVYSNNKYYKIVGNICMNHMFLEVDKSFDVTKEIEIISKNNSILKMANYLNTIPGEVITRLNLNKIYKW